MDITQDEWGLITSALKNSATRSAWARDNCWSDDGGRYDQMGMARERRMLALAEKINAALRCTPALQQEIAHAIEQAEQKGDYVPLIALLKGQSDPAKTLSEHLLLLAERLKRYQKP